MAIESGRRIGADLVERVLAPVGWMQQGIARLLGWFNQERWTNLLTILALVLGNLVILLFLLQGQDNRAIAFVILALIAPLAFLIPELSIVAFISAGAGLFVNAMYFAAGPGMGTGERTLTLLFGTILSMRALYEYVRLPKAARPPLISTLTLTITLFWFYIMLHAAYIYIFQYNQIPVHSSEAVLGIYRPGIFRYFDYHMLWIGIFPILILMHDFSRFRKVAILLGVVMTLSLVALLWEFFAPLPIFFKIIFQFQAAGQTTEGYRVRDPAPLYMFMIGFFYALYMIGFLKGWRNLVAMLFIIGIAFGILITKNRILWAGTLVMLPVVLIWKPPQVLLRQISVFLIMILFGLASMFHPVVRESVTRIVQETIERWSRNYAYGGDPTLDPSYQGRVREREALEWRMQKASLFSKLFGTGLEAGYGRYISLYEAGYYNPRFTRLYVEKSHVHFAWLGRLYHIGLIGTMLLIIVIISFFTYSIKIFLSVKEPTMRGIVMGVVGATVGVLFYDSLHTLLDRSEALPVILMWSLIILIPYWQRTGQLKGNNFQSEQGGQVSPV